MVQVNETEREFSALEEGLAVNGEVVDDDGEFEGVDEEQLMTDLNEAIIFIKRSKTLIDFLSDPELCKTISKRERTTMTKLSGNLEEFLVSIEGSYGNIGSVGHDL